MSPRTRIALERCPFAAARNSREAMAACPGYSGQPIAGPPLSAAAGPGTSCGHLAAHPLSTGRFIPACFHPEADWVLDAARAMLRHNAFPREVRLRGVVRDRVPPCPELAPM